MSSEWFETFFEGPAVEFWTRATLNLPTSADCDYLEKAFDLTPGARILDVPCGHGRHSIELARRGYRVTGVDLSPDFLAAAEHAKREAGVDVDFLRGDMRDLSLPGPFDAAFCFGNSFGYLCHSNAGVFLRQLAALIRPQGRIAIDTGVSAESIFKTLSPQRWHRMGDLIVLSQPDFVPAEGRLDIAYTFITEGHIKAGRIETRPTSSYVFTAAEYRRMLESAGFGHVALASGLSGERFVLGSPWLLLSAQRL